MFRTVMQTESHNSSVLYAEPNWQCSRQWGLTAGDVFNEGM